jgi:tRNA(His) guanylyltransferase
MSTETHFRELESAWKPVVPAHAYTILRVDGRNFSSFTKNMDKPFDMEFIQNMDLVAVQLCKEIQNARFAYVQSDEISIFICTEDEKAQAWFGGTLPKLVSVSAGMASSAMTALYGRTAGQPLICFDSRVFTVPSREDVLRYFMWRQGDAFRNAVSMAASAKFSHKALHKKPVWDRLIMLQEVGTDFCKTYPKYIWQGRVVTPENRLMTVSYARRDTGEEITEEVWRTFWKPDCAPMFDWDTAGFLEKNVPLREEK